MQTPAQGAEPVVYLATSEKLEGVSGEYFHQMSRKDLAPVALDEQSAVKLWDATKKLITQSVGKVDWFDEE